MRKKKTNIIAVCIVILVSIETYCFSSEGIQSLLPQAEKIVSNHFDNQDARIRVNAIEVASAVKGIFDSRIIALLKDNVVPVRFAAAVALGDMECESAKNDLKLLLRDPDLNVRMAAAYALCKLGENKYLQIIRKAADVNDQTVKANAALLLGKLKDADSLPVLYRLKDSRTSSDAVAFNATEAIARIGDSRIYSKIWTMLISIYTDDRCMGIYAMAALGGRRGIDTIVTMLDDDIEQVRLVAAERLGSLGDKSGENVVLEYLNSPDKQRKPADIEKCNVIAALAIGQIGSDRLVEYLPKFLKSESPAVQLAAAKSVFLLSERY